jgi:hypothetical protein
MSFYAMLLLTGATAIVSCRKDVSVLGDQYEKSGTGGDLFHIRCATLDDGQLTLELFHCGTADHEFELTWDGSFNNPFPDSCTACRQVEIRVEHHGTNQDEDSLWYGQQVAISLADLKLTVEDMKTVTFMKIVNTTDPANTVLLFAGAGQAKGGDCTLDNGSGDGDDENYDPDMIYNLPVLVIETSCTGGAWKSLWLKTDFSEQDSVKPAFNYLMPVFDYASDSLGYSPKAGDKLLGDFKKVESDIVCEELKSQTQPVNIYNLRIR